MHRACFAVGSLAMAVCFSPAYAQPSNGAMAFEKPASKTYMAYSAWLAELEGRAECVAQERIGVPERLKPYLGAVAATCKLEQFGGQRQITRTFVVQPKAITWFGFPVRVLNYESVYLLEDDVVLSSSIVATVEASAASLIPRVRRAWTESGRGQVREPRARAIELELEAAVERVVCDRKNTCEYSYGHSY